MANRISIEEYALSLAAIAAKRSEDPYRQVGAVALTPENRVIATAYNGLSPGNVVGPAFWEFREIRLPYMIHAEQNICSLFKRGEVNLVAITTMPCSHCILTLAAHGVKQVIYINEYERDDGAIKIAQFHHVKLTKWDISASRMIT